MDPAGLWRCVREEGDLISWNLKGMCLASLLGFGFVGNLTVAVEASQGAPGVVASGLVGFSSSFEGLDLMFELVSVMWGQFWCSARPSLD
jgi:hypothetical protein